MNRGREVWVIQPQGSGPGARLLELWQYRRLLSYFARGAVQRTYRATVLGWVWLVLRPLVPVLISTLVFHQFAGVQSDPYPYFLFFLVGTASWSLFEESVMWATRSLQLHRRLLTKLYFPHLILPVATMAPALVEGAIYLVLILSAIAYYWLIHGQLYLATGFTPLLSVLALAAALGMALGLGLWTAVLGAEMRDVRFTMRYIMRFWFFLTPVIYPISLIPTEWRWLALLNPMTVIVQGFRTGLLGEPATITAGQIAVAGLLLVGLLVSGLWFFTRAEAAAIDRL